MRMGESSLVGGTGEASGSGSGSNSSDHLQAGGDDSTITTAATATTSATAATGSGAADSQATTTSASATASTSSSSSSSGRQSTDAENVERRVGGNSGGRPGRGPPTSHLARPTSLGEAMRAPGTRAPDVHVIGQMPSDLNASRKDSVLDPREDLWLTTFDGRYNSTLIPIHVGVYPDAKTFTVHKSLLERVDFFHKALCGHFRESETQSISLPEEDPAIFHHIVAFLYEGRYEPIKPIASELIPDVDKGKGREPAEQMDTDSDSAESILSNSTARSRRRRERRRRRDDRAYETMRQKRPGVHRPNCNCPQCLNAGGSPCWNCNAPRQPPPPGPPPHILRAERERERQQRHRRYRLQPNVVNVFPNDGPMPPVGGMRPGSPPPLPGGPSALGTMADPNGGRIKGEDMRTWLLTYELNIDVYICANKYLMDGLKRAVARASIDMLESAGSDAAHPHVLQLCRRLYDGLGTDTDPLLRMIFARIGFLQPVFNARGATVDETTCFLLANPDIVALILRETTSRREEDLGSRGLPSMERQFYLGGGPGALTPGSAYDGAGHFFQGRTTYHNHHFHVPPRPPRFP
ncbi:hypothetical protein GGTG_03694 [Gaeumannomyces tritici R3-111a-1]|uniref:BTB domain-containing protein n=1 Tax=Gaeumannomyces tritici (strain R3-111a-1) TaxID=644352 RepID=J3NQY9_GAET3|nr:hypothetical protein GGTG_03694 [Gaeumannomyces tritici R3-111a-1]EJT78595.1 hypothetical protein GGTG_03694 [Gaeumannomyces tritici R3-111a-1]